MNITEVTQINPPGHQVYDVTAWENSALAKLEDGRIYAVYRTIPDGDLYLREVGPHRCPPMPILEPSPIGSNAYHYSPSIVALQGTKVWVCCGIQVGTVTGRTVHQVVDVELGPEPMAVQNNPAWHDASKIYFGAVAEGVQIPNAGLSRVLVLLDPITGAITSVDEIVHARNHQPPWATNGGNDFAKGDQVGGWQCWTHRTSFTESGKYYETNHGVYLAHFAELPTDIDDAASCIYDGPAHQNSSRGFDVLGGQSAVLVTRPKSGAKYFGGRWDITQSAEVEVFCLAQGPTGWE